MWKKIRLKPQEDITTYELALILQQSMFKDMYIHSSQWSDIPGNIQRHLSLEDDDIIEPKSSFWKWWT
jgi:hypothetical protein